MTLLYCFCSQYFRGALSKPSKAESEYSTTPKAKKVGYSYETFATKLVVNHIEEIGFAWSARHTKTIFLNFIKMCSCKVSALNGNFCSSRRQ